MAISDADSSKLAEAVAALKVVTPPPVKMPSAKAIAALDPGGTDSGYASKNTSQSSTPDSSKGAFTDSGAVVGKARISWGLQRRTKMKLIPFDKPIPRLTQNRFEDLRELHADSLNKLTRGLPRCRGILMSLKVLGQSESTAAPWIFIQCDKAIARKVRGFFKQPAVQSDFNPSSPDAYTPKFEIYVHEMPPTALHRNSSLSNTSQTYVHGHETIEVYCQQDAISTLGSLCGLQISVSTHGHVRSATIGGLISIREKDGTFRMVGITAGHFLAAEQYDECQVDGGDLEEDLADDLDDEFSDDDVFEIDLDLVDTKALTSSEPGDTQYERSEKFESIIGHVYMASQDDLEDQPNLDWALFTIENSLLYLPNVVTKHEIARINCVGIHEVEVERNVVLMTAMSGPVSGILSRSWSLSSRSRLGVTVLITSTVLQPGDSGAWVVDDITNEVYGHVVASDVFGRAYVVPINDIFEDIKRRLSLEMVTLPLGYAIYEPRPDIPAHSVGTPAGSRNNQQRDHIHNVPIGSSPKQPLHSTTAEPRKTISGLGRSNSLPANLTPDIQQNAPNANLTAPNALKPNNTSQNNVDFPGKPTPAYFKDLDKAVYMPFQQQPYGVIQDDPYGQLNIGAYSRYNERYLTFGSHIPMANELPPQTKVHQPYVDSGYSTMNNSPAPSPPSASFSPNMPNQESDPSGESRFQRFKGKIENLKKKISRI
ncbi:Ankyrin repeat domain-containing 52 protein [Rutstroemia sp. NJR-2017a WRK4]|nr:Ankyrin repeat domain-containing 52 protein [Rutstroemia sp. NJR-2017a WRK4]